MAAAGYRRAEVTLSLLDRLIDLEPESTREPFAGSAEQVRAYRNALCRDLTALLNTRRAPDEIDPAYEEMATSLLTFGVIDFTSYNLKKGNEQEQLRRSVERAIRQFEPRLERVLVSVEDSDAQRLRLRLQISAVLAGEAGDPIVLEATVHRDTRRIAVSGGA